MTRSLCGDKRPTGHTRRSPRRATIFNLAHLRSLGNHCNVKSNLRTGRPLLGGTSPKSIKSASATAMPVSSRNSRTASLRGPVPSPPKPRGISRTVEPTRRRKIGSDPHHGREAGQQHPARLDVPQFRMAWTRAGWVRINVSLNPISMTESRRIRPLLLHGRSSSRLFRIRLEPLSCKQQSTAAALRKISPPPQRLVVHRGRTSFA